MDRTLGVWGRKIGSLGLGWMISRARLLNRDAKCLRQDLAPGRFKRRCGVQEDLVLNGFGSDCQMGSLG